MRGGGGLAGGVCVCVCVCVCVGGDVGSYKKIKSLKKTDQQIFSLHHLTIC